jgi:O-antigen/teichoic acid export membrane protein
LTFDHHNPSLEVKAETSALSELSFEILSAIMKDMDNISYLRKVLFTGASVFGFSALLLVFSPVLFNELLGISSTPDLDWAMRMIGLTLVALAGNMLSVSLKGKDSAVVFSARVMAISAAGLGVLTLLIPAETLTWFDYSYAAVGFGFSLAYLIGLFRAPKVSNNSPR